MKNEDLANYTFVRYVNVSSADIGLEVESLTNKIKDMICCKVGNGPTDKRLRVLDNTRRQYECFLLWDARYIGETCVNIGHDRILVTFIFHKSN